MNQEFITWISLFAEKFVVNKCVYSTYKWLFHLRVDRLDYKSLWALNCSHPFPSLVSLSLLRTRTDRNRVSRIWLKCLLHFKLPFIYSFIHAFKLATICKTVVRILFSFLGYSCFLFPISTRYSICCNQQYTFSSFQWTFFTTKLSQTQSKYFGQGIASLGSDELCCQNGETRKNDLAEKMGWQ